MNIKKATAIAAGHFLQTYKGGETTLELLRNYATEELELSPEQANEFAKIAESGLAVKELSTDDDYKRFYTWYYINRKEEIGIVK